MCTNKIDLICLACQLFFRIINSRTIRFMYRQRDQDVHLKVLITLHDIIFIFYACIVVSHYCVCCAIVACDVDKRVCIDES